MKTILLLCCFLICLILALFNYFKKRLTLSKVPGPKTVPLIGHALDLFVPTDKLWHFIRKLSKEYYPIYRLSSFHIVAIQILSPEDIERVVSGTKNMQKGELYKILMPWLQTGLLTNAGTKWHYRRKLLTPAFHFSILQNFLHIFVEHSKSLTKRLEKECDKDFTEVFSILSEFTLHSVCESALGTQLNPQRKQHASYIKAIRRMGQLMINRIIRPWLYIETVYIFTSQYREQSKLVKYLHNFSMSVIQKRKANFKEHEEVLERIDQDSKRKKMAMLDLLLIAQKNGADIDDNGIREEVDTFMFEGQDTTSTSLTFTLMLVANHPEAQNKIFEELSDIFGNSDRRPTNEDLQNMTYLELVIKESLRMYPSVPFIARVTDEQIITKDGYIIPPNTSIHILIWDVHYDPKIYPDPKKFDPYRFLSENSQQRHHFAYLPFSAGPRNCIGQRFAMMEMKVALSDIIRNFVLNPIDKPDNLVLVQDIILRTRDPVKVKFTRR